jgi:hypothetical protein
VEPSKSMDQSAISTKNGRSEWPARTHAKPGLSSFRPPMGQAIPQLRQGRAKLGSRR